MKKIIRISAILLLAVCLLTLCGCDGSQRKLAYVNHNLQGTSAFSFGTADENEGMRASGTVYVQKEENEATATITAHLKRGESHGEGASFYVAKGWIVTGVLSDFPKSGTLGDRFDAATIVKTADSGSDWAYIVEIGCDRNLDIPDGAEGDVIIDLKWDYMSSGPKNFTLLAGVGAGYSGGTTANGVDSVITTIPLS